MRQYWANDWVKVREKGEWFRESKKVLRQCIRWQNWGKVVEWVRKQGHLAWERMVIERLQRDWGGQDVPCGWLFGKVRETYVEQLDRLKSVDREPLMVESKEKELNLHFLERHSDRKI